MIKNAKLYSYTGFSEPEEIDINDLAIQSNYLGDITDEFMEEYSYVANNYTLEEAISEQPLAAYGIWIEPTLEILQDKNQYSYGLARNTYLENFTSL